MRQAKRSLSHSLARVWSRNCHSHSQPLVRKPHSFQTVMLTSTGVGGNSVFMLSCWSFGFREIYSVFCCICSRPDGRNSCVHILDNWCWFWSTDLLRLATLQARREKRSDWAEGNLKAEGPRANSRARTGHSPGVEDEKRRITKLPARNTGINKGYRKHHRHLVVFCICEGDWLLETRVCVSVCFCVSLLRIYFLCMSGLFDQNRSYKQCTFKCFFLLQKCLPFKGCKRFICMKLARSAEKLSVWSITFALGLQTLTGQHNH